jgi:6-phosphofructo-2-kinase.
MEKRKQIHDYFARKMGFKVLFVELIVQDEEILEHNIKVRNIYLYSFFDCKYFNGLLSGVLVLTQHLKPKWEVLCLFSPI